MELILIVVCAAMASPWFQVRSLSAAQFPHVPADLFSGWHRVRMRSLHLFAAAAASGGVLMTLAYVLGYNFGRTLPEWIVLVVGVPLSIGWIVLVIVAFTTYSSARSLAHSAGLHQARRDTAV